MKSQPKRILLRLASIAVVGIATLGIAERLGQAQEPEKVSPEVQQLMEKLQKLEKTVEELKTQLSVLEKPAKSPTPAAIITPKAESPAGTAVLPAATAAAPATTASPNQDKTGENTFQVYGFAMLDAGFQFKQNDPDWFDVVRPTKLPAFGDQFAPNGNTYFGVRQTRFGVKSTTATKYGELKTIFEFELFDFEIEIYFQLFVLHYE